MRGTHGRVSQTHRNSHFAGLFWYIKYSYLLRSIIATLVSNPASTRLGTPSIECRVVIVTHSHQRQLFLRRFFLPISQRWSRERPSPKSKQLVELAMISVWAPMRTVSRSISSYHTAALPTVPICGLSAESTMSAHSLVSPTSHFPYTQACTRERISLDHSLETSSLLYAPVSPPLSSFCMLYELPWSWNHPLPWHLISNATLLRIWSFSRAHIVKWPMRLTM